MIVFVENAYALVVLKLDEELRRRTWFYFVYDRLQPLGATQILPPGRVKFVSARAIRFWKAALGLLQLPIVQPDPLGVAYAVNRWKLLMSDGLLTEMLMDKGFAQPRAFYTVAGRPDAPVPKSKTPLIIGSNWMEHGSMTEAQYTSHLHFLNTRYPDAVYVRHPREVSRIPETVFGNERTFKPDLPIDLHCLNAGVPEQIIGVCSTSMLVLPMLAQGRVDVDLIVLKQSHLGGPKAGVLQRVEVSGRPAEVVHVGDMQRFLVRKLQGVGRSVRVVEQPLPVSTVT